MFYSAVLIYYESYEINFVIIMFKCVLNLYYEMGFGMWVCHTRRWHAGGQICLCGCVRRDNKLSERLALNVSMKTQQGALTFIYNWLIAVKKLLHTYIQRTDKCAQNCGIIHSHVKFILKHFGYWKWQNEFGRSFSIWIFCRCYRNCVADLSLSSDYGVCD